MDENQKLNTADQREGRTLSGMFSDRESAERSYQNLRDKGYTDEDINLIMSDDTRKKHFQEEVVETEMGSKAMDGAGKGSAIGGTIGAVAGVIAALGTSVLIPGLGILIAGPILAGLAGAGAGGITGGLIGALIGSGIPEEKAKVYESGVNDGKILMNVKPRNEEDGKYFEEEWKKNKGEEIHW